MTLLSSAFMPHVVMGMFTSESENMRAVYRTVSSQTGARVFKNAKANVVTVSRPVPTMLMTRGPWRSNMRPVMGPMMPMRMAPGMRMSPDMVAERPSSDCT